MTVGRSSEQRKENYRKYVGMERGLQIANRKYITIDTNEMEDKRKCVEQIVNHLVGLMKEQSPTFEYLFDSTFGGGSGYEGLKITKPDEFDIDILLRIPKTAGAVLIENNIPGYVNLQLTRFDRLQKISSELHTEMKLLVDEKNYLQTKELKGSFMQSIFDRVMRSVPDNVIMIGRHQFRITRVQSLGPAFTLTIQGPRSFYVSVDLVPCIVLDKSQWPKGGFESNPYATPSDFFIVPKSPKRDMPHIDRYWRLSFQKQEREIIFDKQWLKPAIRVMKRIRDHFGHKISSYAIKNIFLVQLKLDNPTLDEDIPELWLSPLSYCVVYMLELYTKCLSEGKIPYFWNKKMNLIEDLTPVQTSQYKSDIDDMLEDIKLNPVPATILKYLR